LIFYQFESGYICHIYYGIFMTNNTLTMTIKFRIKILSRFQLNCYELNQHLLLELFLTSLFVFFLQRTSLFVRIWNDVILIIYQILLPKAQIKDTTNKKSADKRIELKSFKRKKNRLK
jgi:hypothetical protein